MAAKRGPESSSPVSYQLLIGLSRSARVDVGRLGRFSFPAGFYVYSGSARRNIAARLARHLRREKKLRWHVDYLLAARGARVVAVLESTESECQLCQRLGGEILVPRFGASDCVAGCGSHLRYLGETVPRLAQFRPTARTHPS